MNTQPIEIRSGITFFKGIISRNLAVEPMISNAYFLEDGEEYGSLKPETLREVDLQVIDLGDCEVRGWRVGNKVALPTPGHSPCSVLLFWPERKALFLSDADWLGNPVFVSSSVRDGISSLEKLKGLAEAGKVDLLLPGHGQATEGADKL